MGSDQSEKDLRFAHFCLLLPKYIISGQPKIKTIRSDETSSFTEKLIAVEILGWKSLKDESALGL